MSARARRAWATLAALLLSRAAGAAEQAVERVELAAVSVEGCNGVPYPRAPRELLLDGDRAVDASARFWQLDRASAYARGRASRRYRIGRGALAVDATLDPDLRREVVRISVAEPIEPEYRAVYLAGIALPCERVTRYGERARGAARADLDAMARFDRLLHEATELLYDDRFAAAERLLREAMALAPRDAAPHWMLARLRFLALESGAARLARSERVAAFHAAERDADEAVARSPARAEGYLWQAIARGRIATSSSQIALAARGWLGGRGPRWLEETMRKAVSMQEEFRFFGFSTRGDALHALAQFYRIAPHGWYMGFVGTGGDIDRAIALSVEAVTLQPTRLEYRKELAVELLCRGSDDDIARARRELAAVLALPAFTALDRIDRAHAARILREPPAAVCSYSRDAFEDVGA